MEAALNQLRAEGFEVKAEDVARLSPLVYKHINFQGRYSFALSETVAQGGLRPLRDPYDQDDVACTSQVSVPLLVRRAKLGFASQGQVLTPEVLARHRVPRVASLKVTTTAKRTQGGDGPQCASVKGLSPVMNG